MSWQASSHVLKLAERTSMEELSHAHVVVLYALAARHNDRDYHCAFGQLERMARDTHLHVVTLSRLLGQLEDRGIITVWEGQLPQFKDAPEDGRRTRGTMWCFVDLDPEDGPNIAGAVPRVRTSGRPKAKSISAPLNQLEGSISRNGQTELAQNGRSISAPLQTELALLTRAPDLPVKPDVQTERKPDVQTETTRVESTNGRSAIAIEERPRPLGRPTARDSPAECWKCLVDRENDAVQGHRGPCDFNPPTTTKGASP
jgi:DNA-binding MarR family transcriptional regulator